MEILQFSSSPLSVLGGREFHSLSTRSPVVVPRRSGRLPDPWPRPPETCSFLGPFL